MAGIGQQLRFSSNFWPKGTWVRMINVPWDSSYKDVVQFDDEDARDEWLDARPAADMATTGMTYVAPGASIVLPCPVTTAERFNYLYVQNPSYDITDGLDDYQSEPRRYCYFISEAAWVSPAACRVSLQLDVWATWAPFVHFTRALVARGHAAIANRNLWDGTTLMDITPAKMRRYLMTPEEVDPGGEFYPITTSWTDLTIPPTGQGQAGTYVGVMSSVDLSVAWGTATNPNIATASGSVQEGILAGTQVIYFKVADFLALLDDLRDAPWVSRNIMQIWLVPGKVTAMQSIGTIHGHTYYRPGAASPSDYPVATINAAAALSAHHASHKLVAPKLMTAPYCFVELNAFEGSPLILKPQRTSSLSGLVLYARGLVMAPWDRIAIYPLFYGSFSTTDILYYRQDINGNTVQSTLHPGDSLDAALWITELPRFSFTSDGYLNWLAQGAHSRAWSYQNNDWNYHKISLSRDVGFQQATEQQDLAIQQRGEQNQLWNEQFWLNTLSSAVDSVGADPFATVGDLAKTGLNAYMSSTSRDLENRQFTQQQELARQQRLQNNKLAGYAARGDYQQAYASLMATQKDAELTPPSVVGSAGGRGWNYAMGLLGFRTCVKVCGPQQEQILVDYFQRFGYAINELMDMPSDLRLMDKFTYWKLQESFLDGNVTEAAKNIIRGIFERGTTVWSSPEDITTFSFETSSNGINASNQFSY